AEHVAESLARGLRVIVQGRLKQRSYEDREGVKRTVYELDVDEVGPSLTFATAKVTKASGGGNRGNSPTDDPWAGAKPAGGQQQGGGWGNTPPAQQQPAPQGAGYSDEPPF
ncbi:single-stranded DNA-binding protein, partial [Streptomyces sp. SID5926]|nr:single-stranded DNA-binding protein [Streptomyces sp. SID5926]